jgi:hypothetical protein
MEGIRNIQNIESIQHIHQVTQVTQYTKALGTIELTRIAGKYPNRPKDDVHTAASFQPHNRGLLKTIML